MKTYTHRFGTLEVGLRFEQFKGASGWRRTDRYSPDPTRSVEGWDPRPVLETCFAASRGDFSDVVAREAYDPDCSCCWLGFSHTWDYHESSLGSSSASRQAVSDRAGADPPSAFAHRLLLR